MLIGIPQATATLLTILIFYALDFALIHRYEKQRHASGSWGTYISTAEETAYAIQALWVWNEKVARIPQATLKNDARWLKENLEKPYPPLWIGKCLNSPQLVVRSAVLSALALAQ